MKKLSHQHGFTIIELMFATVVFSAVLLLCLTGIIQIGRVYYKGVTTARTQEAARSLMDEVAQSIQFSADAVTLSSGPAGPDVTPNPADPSVNYRFACIGDRRLSFVIDRRVTGTVNENEKTTAHGAWVDDLNSCSSSGAVAVNLSSSNPGGTNGRELLGDNMRLSKFDIDCGVGNGLCRVSVGVVYGSQDLIEYVDGSAKCKGSVTDTQYCAFSELNTLVQKRVQ